MDLSWPSTNRFGAACLNPVNLMRSYSSTKILWRFYPVICTVERIYTCSEREGGRERMEKFCIIMFNNNCLSIDRSLVIYTNILVITLSTN